MQKVLIGYIKGDYAQILAEQLRKQYRVTVRHSGVGVLDALRRLQPEILIVFLGLPRTDGLTVLKKTRHTPPVILALSDLITDEIVEQAAAAGVKALIRTPCSVEYLARRLEELQKQS